jgi:hypothetical protein
VRLPNPPLVYDPQNEAAFRSQLEALLRGTATGTSGAPGPQGEPGPEGPQGPEGPEGPKGDGAGVVVGPTAPPTPIEGDLWFDTDDDGGGGGGGGSGEDTWRTLSVALTQVARDLTNVTYRLDGGPSVDLVALQYATVPEVLTGEPLPLTEPIVWALPGTTITVAWPSVNYVTFVRAVGHDTVRGVYGLATELALDPRAVQ